MKLWGIVRKKQKIVDDAVMEFPGGRPQSVEAWEEVLSVVCHKLHLSRPILLNKHFEQLTQFARTAFLPADFIETVTFDRFEIEIFPEKTQSPGK
ncbi:hypothetical protein LJC07_02310 [Christensenellaceae bacterium OttesenSCG-928-L17]|nr:hypothetical protein [Christensenellaceae bacterium OttesenSCG-928-L17]